MPVAIAAIMKNEAPYIEEWINFHVRQGVTEFFLYDNESSDNTIETATRALQEVDRLTRPVRSIAGKCRQLGVYMAAADVALRQDVTWLAFIDVDEFLFSPTCKPLPVVLENYNRVDGLVVHWLIYGSSGHQNYSPENVTHRFTKRQQRVNEHVKTICRPFAVRSFFSPHAVDYEPGCVVVDEHHNSVPSGTSRIYRPATTDILRINHYVTKSYQECRNKCARGRADTGNQRPFEEFFAEHDLNEFYDPIAMNL